MAIPSDATGPQRAMHDDDDEDAAIDRALREAVRDAILRHKHAGNPIVVYRDGAIVEVPANEIEWPAENDARRDP